LSLDEFRQSLRCAALYWTFAFRNHKSLSLNTECEHIRQRFGGRLGSWKSFLFLELQHNRITLLRILLKIFTADAFTKQFTRASWNIIFRFAYNRFFQIMDWTGV